MAGQTAPGDDELFAVDSYTVERHLVKVAGMPQSTQLYVLMGIILFMMAFFTARVLAWIGLFLMLVGMTHFWAKAMTPPAKLVYSLMEKLVGYEGLIRKWFEYRPKEEILEVPLAKIVKGMRLEREMRRRYAGLVDVYMLKLIKTPDGVLVLDARTHMDRMTRIDRMYVYGREVYLYLKGVISEPGYYVIVLVDTMRRSIVDKFVLRVY